MVRCDLFRLFIGSRGIAAFLRKTVACFASRKIRESANDSGTLASRLLRRPKFKFLRLHFGRKTQGQRVRQSRCAANTSP